MSTILKFLSFFIHPMSPFVLAIITLLIQPTEVNMNSPLWQRFLYNDTTIKRGYILYGAWALAACLNWYWQQKKVEFTSENNKLQEIIKEKERRLEQESGILLSKYSDLARFKYKDILFNIAKTFTDSNRMVEATQIYKYSTKIHKDETIVKVEFENGYAYEEFDTNVILQEYYVLSNNRYGDIIKIIDYWKKIKLSEKNEIDPQIYNLWYQELNRLADEFIGNTVQYLNNKPLKNYDKDDATLYGALLLVIGLINDDEANPAQVIIKVLNDSRDEYLYSYKRTGIFCSILFEDGYVFKHGGISEKKGRIYLTDCIILNGQHYVILLSLSPSDIASSDDFIWKRELDKLRISLKERLIIEFDSSK